MAATFVSKKCRFILELYKVIHFDTNYFYEVEIDPVKQVTYLSAWHSCCLLFRHGLTDGYQCTNHNMIYAFIWNWKNAVLNL